MRDAFGISLKNMIIPNLMWGVSMGAAIAKVLPFWKAMGGVLPADPLEEMWNKIQDKSPLFKTYGTVMAFAAGEIKSAPHSSSWQLE